MPPRRTGEPVEGEGPRRPSRGVTASRDVARSLCSLGEIVRRFVPDDALDRAEGALTLLSRALSEGPGVSRDARVQPANGIDLDLARPEHAFTGLPEGSLRFQGAVKRLNALIRPDGIWKDAARSAHQAVFLWPAQRALDESKNIAMRAASLDPWQPIEETAEPSPENRVLGWLVHSPGARDAQLARVPGPVGLRVRKMVDPWMLLLWLYSGARKRADGYVPGLLAMGGVGSWTIENPECPPPRPPGLQGLAAPATLPPLPLYPLTDAVAKSIGERLANEPDPLSRLRVCSDPRCTLDTAPHTCRPRNGEPVTGRGPFYVDRAERHRVKASVACCPTHEKWVNAHKWAPWVFPATPQ